MRQAAGKKGDRVRRAGRRGKLHFAKRFRAKFRELSCAKSCNQCMRIHISIFEKKYFLQKKCKKRYKFEMFKFTFYPNKSNIFKNADPCRSGSLNLLSTKNVKPISTLQLCVKFRFAFPNSAHLASKTETLVRGRQVQLVLLLILRNLFTMNLGKVGTNSFAVAGQKKHLNFALPLYLSINQGCKSSSL
jgi:hypothetical protein